ncbi:hypothetical protein bhDAH_001047 (plasmid) [Borrelia hermsii DAH]|nr:hypothetical protein bhDAH_001047 [Borrelia hermsii DAH]
MLIPYIGKICIKNSSVEKEELYYNAYNKGEKKDIKEIEKLQVEKHAKKCNFKSNTFFSILNLKLEKDATIEVLKVLKRTENFLEKSIYKRINGIKSRKSKLKSK